MEDIGKRIELHRQLADFFSNKSQVNITEKEIVQALIMRLGDKFGLEHPAQVWDLPIDLQDAQNALDDFNFHSLNATIITDGSELEGIALFETKALIKAAGQIWIIHRYDADPFPSNPHAHNLEQNIKLSLSDGRCFQNRLLLKTLRKKDLLAIRAAAAERYKGPLPELEV
jgi:hypothetical protein